MYNTDSDTETDFFFPNGSKEIQGVKNQDDKHQQLRKPQAI